MNLKAIKERCERYAQIRAMTKQELNQLDWDEWWGPIEEMEIAESAAEDIPELLAWVSRAARLFERFDMTTPTSHVEKVTALLAELEDEEINDKGD